MILEYKTRIRTKIGLISNARVSYISITHMTILLSYTNSINSANGQTGVEEEHFLYITLIFSGTFNK
jgi:hypothetical protein